MSEHDEQVKVIQWCRLMALTLDWRLSLIFATPNQGGRTPWSGRKFVAEGLKKGVPDLCLPVAAGPYNALFIEMKYGKGKLSSDQKKWISLLEKASNKCAVCYSGDEAIEIIERYLRIKDD